MSDELNVELVSPLILKEDKLQPRKRFDEDALYGMAISVHEKGVVQPVQATCKNVIVFGHRRNRGARMCVEGFEYGGVVYEAKPDLTIPVIYRDLSDQEVFEFQMIENLQRSDMTPVEEARGYERLKTEFGQSANALSETLGVDQKRVSSRLRLLQLDDATLKDVDDGVLPLYAAELVLRVAESDRQEALSYVRGSVSMASARSVIESRFLRPARERGDWVSFVNNAEVAREYFENWSKEGIEADCEGLAFEVLPYQDCREIYPADITELHVGNAGEFVLAESWPDLAHDGLAPGKTSSLCWGDLAAKFGAPFFIACDGLMKKVVLCRRDLIREAEELAVPELEDRIFRARNLTDIREQGESAKVDKVAHEEATEARRLEIKEMIQELDLKVREYFSVSADVPDLVVTSVFWNLQLAALGFDSMAVEVNELLGIEDGEEILSGWPDFYSDGGKGVGAMFSLCLCGMIWYRLSEWDEEKLSGCPDWVQAASLFNVEGSW